MKIGILTYHWSTNHGAVLQAWCLQEYLREQGHEVDIIHYKPRKLDLTWMRIALHPKRWLSLGRQLAMVRKETALIPFRERHLHLTRRYFSVSELGPDLEKYDVLVSGSDQVLNPSFTLQGDNGKPSPAYWLGIGPSGLRRLGYAVSFGCETYPESAAVLARRWVGGFDAVGVREHTGFQILDSLHFTGPKCLVPDPTLLLGACLFDKLGVAVPEDKESYTCVYMLRHEISLEGNVRYLDDRHHPLSVEEWLSAIVRARALVTNSYHGTLMAVLAHVPFVVLPESGGGSGMNDRFLTLLERLGCMDRIARAESDIPVILDKPMDFNGLDAAAAEFRREGERFLEENLIG